MQKLAGVLDLFRNPLLEKDLRTTGRSPKFFLFLMTFIVIAAIVVLITVQSNTGRRQSSGLSIYLAIYAVQAISIALVIPAYACTTIANERQRRTYNLLIISSLKPWEIAWGKFLAIMVYILLFLAAFLPLVGICFLYGGVPPSMIIYSYVGMLLSAATATAFCLMLSAASSNPIVTVIVGYIFMFMFGGGFTNIFAMIFFLVGRGQMGIGNVGALSIVIMILVSFFSWSLFYLASVAILKPASWNKSTPLRLWLVAFSIACFSILLYQSATVGGLTPEDLIIYSLIFVVFPCLFSAIGFGAEPTKLPKRLEQKVRKLNVFFRLFGPGGGSGIFFTLFIFALHMLGVNLVAAAAANAGFGSSIEDLYTFTAASGLFLLFVLGLSYLGRKLWNTPKSRIIAIASIVAVCMLPMLSFLVDARSPVIWLSPILGYVDLISNEWRVAESGMVLFFGFYSLATILLFGTGLSISKRSRRQLEMTAYADSQA